MLLKKNLKRGDTPHENLSGWLLSVGVKLRLNTLKIPIPVFSFLNYRLVDIVSTGRAVMGIFCGDILDMTAIHFLDKEQQY